MRLGATAERRLITFVPPLVVALLVLPFVLRQNSWFEWSNPYWFLQRQTEHVAATGRPTLFLHLDSGAFYPWFVYYAGPVTALLAYPAVVLGPWTTFVLATVAVTVAGYLGVWWTGRNLGLSRRLAVLPALTFAAAPYVVCEIYGRAAWPELGAIDAAAVLLGGLTALMMRPDGRRVGALAAVTGATAVIAGTHNLTLMLAAIILPLTLLALLPLRPPDAAPLGRAVLRAGAATALGLGLTAAWLLPNLWYGHDTTIAQAFVSDGILTENFGGVTSFSNLLAPWPRIPSQIPGREVYPQAPALVLAWVVVMLAVVLVRRTPPRRVTAASAALVALAAGLIVLVANPTWWLHFPTTLRMIEYPFRLLTFVALLVALAAAVGLRHLPAGGRARGLATGTLALAVAVQLAGALYIAFHSEGGTTTRGIPAPRADEVTVDEPPSAFGDRTAFTSYQFRVMRKPTVRGRLNQDASLTIEDPLTSDTAQLQGRAPVGTLVLLPIAWSPFLHISGGASLAGRDADGTAVLRVDAADADGNWTAEASAATPWPLAVGRVISVVSLLIVLGLGVSELLRWRRRRGATPPGAPVVAAEPERVAVSG
jgi:hypothetical protein